MAAPILATATFTPANTSHTAGDVVGTKQEFVGNWEQANHWVITRATMRALGGTNETSTWTVHLYSALPTTIADDAVYALADADRGSYLGQFTLAQLLDLGGTLYIENESVNKHVITPSGVLYGFLVNGTTVTTAAIDRVVTLYAKPVVD